MTLISDHPKEKKCAICGSISSHQTLISTNSFGSPDLDLRGPGMVRDTMAMWIQRCPSCGYCASDIGKSIGNISNEDISRIVYSVFYKKQLNNSNFTDLANSFLCLSIIMESLGEHVQASHLSLQAAWVCDDLSEDIGAKKCRKKTISLIRKVKKNKTTSRPEDTDAFMVELLRRSGQFKSALKICDNRLKKNPKAMIIDILKFQKKLIKKEDAGCYTVEAALKKTNT